MSRLMWSLTRHPVGLVGSGMAIIAGILLVFFLGLELSGYEGGPYLGILTFMVIPIVFVLGLVLMPLGLFLQRRKAKKEGREPGSARMPVLDLNLDHHRRRLLFIIGVSVVNLSLLAVVTFKGVHYMESSEFCGTTCHTVMNPEYSTYQQSPHAQVGCVDCHIGSGAGWFVKSKLSGSWQVVSVALDLYPRPIPTPVHNLRPARDTCEECHWPTKFLGERLKVIPHFASDETNTESSTVLLLKVGGAEGHRAQGIHWHVDPGNQIRYRADEGRHEIYDVELTLPDGEKRLYTPAGGVPEDAGEWREFDCLDCHNRPSHIYRFPSSELDNAMAEGVVDPGLPFIKREGLRVLEQEYASHEEATLEIDSRLRGYYAENHPDVLATQEEAIGRAIERLTKIYTTNVHPAMNITWGTYLNHLGHEDSPGCFRCHNDEHETEDGLVISQDCETCHTLLAMEEEDPEILQMLRP
ncbi:MAG: NapC/NirT family cytochrome c [Acidobacteria bacterium]|uniref:NapC/NirT family cytochrome c n=1 Tax=Candidatus Polarisedimenticola svalbardensis TaxID=2886004 RepID=A0A8J6Y7Q4_9BACT|nr:NapC/NirT family cytochrome c [Candidatus Polarisedimenticola svalbardensis]